LDVSFLYALITMCTSIRLSSPWCKIWGSHSDEDSDWGLLGCDTM